MIKVCFAVAVLCLSYSPVMADDNAMGQKVFVDHCSVCHGMEGQGDGPLAPALMIKPKDLAKLSGKNDGVFPLARVIMRIDGREGLVSHGSPMPVYGQFFEGRNVMLKTDAGQPVRTTQPIADLVEWIKSIQSVK